MRNMSFALTTEQMRNQTKTVTRRLGWTFLKPGDLIQPVEKCQGLKKGETLKKIGGPIRVLRVSRENLLTLMADRGYGQLECTREGFPSFVPADFAAMFCEHNKCSVEDHITRIEFDFVEPVSRRQSARRNDGE